MKFRSTRGAEQGINSSEAIIKGIASDGGLFVPESFPKIYENLIKNKDCTYEELAFEIIKNFFTDIDKDKLNGAINRAYNKRFKVRVRKKFLELYHGPTCDLKMLHYYFFLKL